MDLEQSVSDPDRGNKSLDTKQGQIRPNTDRRQLADTTPACIAGANRRGRHEEAIVFLHPFSPPTTENSNPASPPPPNRKKREVRAGPNQRLNRNGAATSPHSPPDRERKSPAAGAPEPAARGAPAPGRNSARMGYLPSLGSKAAHFVSDLTTVILNPVSEREPSSHLPVRPQIPPPTPPGPVEVQSIRFFFVPQLALYRGTTWQHSVVARSC